MSTYIDTITLSFRERLLVAIDRMGMEKQALAEYLGVSVQTLWRWETLRAAPRASALRVLANETHLPYEWLRPSPDELDEGRSQYTPRDSNPEPTD